MDYIERIEALGACAPALDWLRSGQYPSLQVGWDACPRGDWLLWVLLKHADGLHQMARSSGHISDTYTTYATYITAQDAVPSTAADAYAAAAIRAVVPVAPTLP